MLSVVNSSENNIKRNEKGFPEVEYLSFSNRSQILRFSDFLEFRVFLLEAPLSVLTETIGISLANGLLNINGFHTGVGFQCTDPLYPYEFCLSLELVNGFAISSFIPEIKTENGKRTLSWKNLNKITIGTYIDMDYWDRSTYMTTITSKQLVEIQNWIFDFWIPNNPIYSIASGIKSDSLKDIFNPIFRPSFCDTFSFSLLSFISGVDIGNQLDPIHNLYVGLQHCIDYVTVPNFTLVSFVESSAGSIVPVSFEQNREEIVSFYETLSNEINDIINIEQVTVFLIQRLLRGDNPDVIVRLIEQELFTAISLIATAYQNFSVVYYYGYNDQNQPQYWKITSPQLFISYINSNLRRNYPSISINNDLINDPQFVNRKTCTYIKNSTSSNILIIFLLIILIIILFVITKNSKKYIKIL